MSNQSSGSADASDGRASNSIAFNNAMAAVDTRCAQLRVSLHKRDCEGVEHTAQGATNAWLAGRVACRRMERANPGSPYSFAACKLLDTKGTTILLLMKRACSAIEAPNMQKVLEDLRRMVATAMSEPLDPSKGRPGA